MGGFALALVLQVCKSIGFGNKRAELAISGLGGRIKSPPPKKRQPGEHVRMKGDLPGPWDKTRLSGICPAPIDSAPRRKSSGGAIAMNLLDEDMIPPGVKWAEEAFALAQPLGNHALE